MEGRKLNVAPKIGAKCTKWFFRKSVNLCLTYIVTFLSPQKTVCTFTAVRDLYFAVFWIACFVYRAWRGANLTLQATCSASSVKLHSSTLFAYIYCTTNLICVVNFVGSLNWTALPSEECFLLTLLNNCFKLKYWILSANFCHVSSFKSFEMLKLTF